MADTSGAKDRPTRLILYVGKGGVGKSTIAAATAIRAATLGHRTLVVSPGPVHSLGDVLGVELGSEPRTVVPLLDAQEINVLDEVRRNWEKVRDELSAVLRRDGATDIQADELAILPGLAEMTALLLIGQHVQSQTYDCVVVDAPPSSETMFLLSLPDTYQWYAARIREWQQRLSRIGGPLLRGFVPDLRIADVLTQVTGRIKELRRVLADPQQSSHRIVLTPDRVVLKEALRVATYLSIYDYPVDAVIVNRLLSGAKSRSSFVVALIERQSAVMDDIRQAFPSVPILTAPWRPDEPVGPDALEATALQLFSDRDPTAVFQVGRSQRIERSPAGYVLKIPMPNVELDKLALRKRGDSLFVDLGAFRRELILPRELATLEPKPARMHDGTLEIPFGTKGDV